MLKKVELKAKAFAEPYIDTRIMQMVKTLPRKAAILDIATGEGYIAEQLYNLGYKNIHTADIAGKYFKLDKRIFHFKDADANKTLPYKNNQFDAVISSETIEHLENPRFFFREANRILKKNGLFILSTPSVESLFIRVLFLITGKLLFFTPKDYELTGHMSLLPSGLLEKFVQEAGFKLKQRTYSCFHIPLIRIRITHHLFLNRLFGWIAVYSFTKNRALEGNPAF